MVDHWKVHLIALKEECKIRLHDLDSIWYNQRKILRKKERRFLATSKGPDWICLHLCSLPGNLRGDIVCRFISSIRI